MSTIAVIFGGPTPEHDINILTGLQAARALNVKHTVIPVYWSKTGQWFRVDPTLEGAAFLDGVPRGAVSLSFRAESGGGFVESKGGLFAKARAITFDTAVVACHGGPGEDGSLQGALDLAGISYTGPSLIGAALGMDKLAFSRVVRASGIPTLDRVLLTDRLDSPGFSGPYIVKPRFGGSSIGIEIVDSLDTAKALLRSSVHLRAGAVIEPYRPESVDLNIGLRMFPSPQASAIEKPVRTTGNAKILGYADKYVGGEGMVSAPKELPAQLDNKTEAQLREMAFAVAEVCDLRGVARLDFLQDGKKLYVNEINTVPGSLAKYLWVEPQIAFEQLLDDMIQEAHARPTTHWTTEGSDGTALRSAGSIAGKLA